MKRLTPYERCSTSITEHPACADGKLRSFTESIAPAEPMFAVLWIER